MTTDLEKKKSKIEEKQKNLLQEKIRLAEKEKKIRDKRFFDIGRLANKANIEHLDNEILLGAFIEISNNSKEESLLKKWKKIAEEFSNEKMQSDKTPIVIKFKTDPRKEILSILKEENFKWCRFRKEFQGLSNYEKIKDLLQETDASIQIIAD